MVDVLQTPAFLCRQTDFIQKVARAGKPVNIKKGQFLAPWDMQHVVAKAKAAGNADIMVCERGASFGYNNLVSDMRALSVMRETGCPVVGIAGLFAETHPHPDQALSDGPNSWPLDKMEALLEALLELDVVTKRHGFLEQHL